MNYRIGAGVHVTYCWHSGLNGVLLHQQYGSIYFWGVSTTSGSVPIQGDVMISISPKYVGVVSCQAWYRYILTCSNDLSMYIVPVSITPIQHHVLRFHQCPKMRRFRVMTLISPKYVGMVLFEPLFEYIVTCGVSVSVVSIPSTQHHNLFFRFHHQCPEMRRHSNTLAWFRPEPWYTNEYWHAELANRYLVSIPLHLAS